MTAPKLIRTARGSWRYHGQGDTNAVSDGFEHLMQAAREVRRHAYAPYSHFHVGAAVAMDDAVYSGCNVENASFGGTVCAERTAIFTGVGRGHRRIDLIAISTDATGDPLIEARSPCGFCRQVIAEFATPDLLVLLDGGYSGSTIFIGDAIPFSLLLPWQFRLS